jgi:hypothetical protein
MAGRLGLAARGAMYAIIGVLAVVVATRHHASAPNRQGALEAVAHQPLGRLLVIGLAAGFLGYAAWRGWSAVFADGLPKRLAHAGRALLYLAAFVTALPFARYGPRHHSAGDKEEVDVTNRVLHWPGGRAIVLAAGLAIVAAGLWQGYRGLSQRYRKKIKWREMAPAAQRTVPAVAVGGFTGRMLAFVSVGVLLVQAALHRRPQDAGGLDAALYRLLTHAYGPWLVAIIGAGVTLFGLYSFVEARYRKLPD